MRMDGSPIQRAKSSSSASLKAKRKSCHQCRKSHLSCDAERPCRRCIRRGIPNLCIDNSVRIDINFLSRLLPYFSNPSVASDALSSAGLKISSDFVQQLVSQTETTSSSTSSQPASSNFPLSSSSSYSNSNHPPVMFPPSAECSTSYSSSSFPNPNLSVSHHAAPCSTSFPPHSKQFANASKPLDTFQELQSVSPPSFHHQPSPDSPRAIFNGQRTSSSSSYSSNPYQSSDHHSNQQYFQSSSSSTCYQISETHISSTFQNIRPSPTDHTKQLPIPPSSSSSSALATPNSSPWLSGYSTNFTFLELKNFYEQLLNFSRQQSQPSSRISEFLKFLNCSSFWQSTVCKLEWHLSQLPNGRDVQLEIIKYVVDYQNRLASIVPNVDDMWTLLVERRLSRVSFYSKFYEMMNEPIILAIEGLKISCVNTRFSEMVGRSKEELVHSDLRIFELMHPADIGPFMKTYCGLLYPADCAPRTRTRVRILLPIDHRPFSGEPIELTPKFAECVATISFIFDSNVVDALPLFCVVALSRLDDLV